MKKMILSLIALLAAMSTSAQVVEIYQNDKLVNAYLNTKANHYKVVFKGQTQNGDETTINTTEAQEIEVSMNGTAVQTYTGTAESPYKVVFKSTGELAATGIINGHPYVKVGKLLWATMNVGATSATGKSTESFGDYYAWGETVTYYQSFDNVGEKDASGSYCQPTYSEEKVQSHVVDKKNGYTWQAYCGADNFTDFVSAWKFNPYGKDNTLTSENDVAQVEWGGGWRMPTQDEVYSLEKECGATVENDKIELTLTTNTGGNISAKGAYDVVANSTIDGVTYGVAGVLFVASDKDKSQRVFFPRAGQIDNNNGWSVGTENNNVASYWTSAKESNSIKAYSLKMVHQISVSANASTLFYGRSIRPVIVLDE